MKQIVECNVIHIMKVIIQKKQVRLDLFHDYQCLRTCFDQSCEISCFLRNHLLEEHAITGIIFNKKESFPCWPFSCCQFFPIISHGYLRLMSRDQISSDADYSAHLPCVLDDA